MYQVRYQELTIANYYDYILEFITTEFSTHGTIYREITNTSLFLILDLLNLIKRTLLNRYGRTTLRRTNFFNYIY